MDKMIFDHEILHRHRMSIQQDVVTKIDFIKAFYRINSTYTLEVLKLNGWIEVLLGI